MFSNTFHEGNKTCSERYLPAWVRTDPENLKKQNNKPKIEKKRPKKKRPLQSRKYSLYTLRETLDDNIIQKLEEADLLRQQIDTHLNGVLSHKIKLKALRKSVLKEYEDDYIENEVLDETKEEEEIRPTDDNFKRKIQKQTFTRKQLFRDRLKWERLNEWKNRPPSRNTYSRDFLTYLGQVKLPGKKQNVNELENLYIAYQELSLQPEEKIKSNKVNDRKLVESIKTTIDNNNPCSENKKETEEFQESGERDLTHDLKHSSESDYEEREKTIRRNSKLKYSLLPKEKVKNDLTSMFHYVSNDMPLMKNSGVSKHKNTEQINVAEDNFSLKKKLSLASVFRKRASLNSLTSVRIKRNRKSNKLI